MSQTITVKFFGWYFKCCGPVNSVRIDVRPRTNRLAAINSMSPTSNVLIGIRHNVIPVMEAVERDYESCARETISACFVKMPHRIKQFTLASHVLNSGSIFFEFLQLLGDFSPFLEQLWLCLLAQCPPFIDTKVKFAHAYVPSTTKEPSKNVCFLWYKNFDAKAIQTQSLLK